MIPFLVEQKERLIRGLLFLPFISILIFSGCSTTSGKDSTRQVSKDILERDLSDQEAKKPGVTEGIRQFTHFKEYLLTDKGVPPKFIHQVLPWKDGMAAACSLTFDDGTLDQYTRAFPLLERYGVKGTFYLLPGLMEEGFWQDGAEKRRLFSWDQAREIAMAGHEIGSHGMFHQDLQLLVKNGRISEAERELSDSADLLRLHLTEWFGPVAAVESLSFCWPFWRYTEKLLPVADSHYLGARAGTGVLDSYSGYYTTDSPHFFEDAFSTLSYNSSMDPQWKFHIDSYGVRSSDTISDLEAFLMLIKEGGGWGILGFHGFFENPGEGAEGWDPVDITTFERFLSLCNDEELWIAPFRDVLSYRLLTDSIQFNLTESGSAGLIGSFTSPYDAEDLAGDFSVDIRFRSEGNTTAPLILDSEGNELPILSRRGDWYRITIVPDGREYAFISWSRIAASN